LLVSSLQMAEVWVCPLQTPVMCQPEMVVFVMGRVVFVMEVWGC
jgi:hypothetical protein